MAIGKLPVFITACAISASTLMAGGLSYYDGIEDTLLVLNQQIQNKKTIESKGYVLYAQISDLSSPELVNYSAIGYRSGYHVFFAKPATKETIIVFGTYERKADALYNKRKLEKDFGLKYLSLYYYPKEMPVVSVIAKGITKYLDAHYRTIVHKERERCGKEEKAMRDAFAKLADGKCVEAIGEFQVDKDSCQQYIDEDRLARSYVTQKFDPQKSAQPATVIIKQPLQVVNRVITKAYLEKNYNGKISAVVPLRSKYSKASSYDNQKESVAKHVVKDMDTAKKLSRAKNLNAFFAILREHAAISSDGNLIIDRKSYPIGSTFGKYELYKTDYKKGVVIVKKESRISRVKGIEKR